MLSLDLALCGQRRAEIYFLKIIWPISSGILAGFSQQRPDCNKVRICWLDIKNRFNYHHHQPSERTIRPQARNPHNHLPIQRLIFRGQTSPLFSYFLTSSRLCSQHLFLAFPFYNSQAFSLIRACSCHEKKKGNIWITYLKMYKYSV